MKTAYINGNIITVNDAQPKAQAMVVEGTTIVAVGTTEDVMALCDSEVAVVDLQGKTAMPGVIESHIHFTYTADNKLKIDCKAKTKEQILQDVKEAAQHTPKGEMITGFGWHRPDWVDQSYPTKEELDAVAPDHYVSLDSSCAHVAWVNSKTLQATGITKDTAEVEGGLIFRDQDGEPTGLLTDTARDFLLPLQVPPSEEAIQYTLEQTQEDYLALGITTVIDTGVGDADIERIDKLQKEGVIKLRYDGVLLADPFFTRPRESRQTIAAALDKYYQQGPIWGGDNDKLFVHGVKLFGDGSMGGESAWMLDDYTGRPNSKGVPVYSDQELIDKTKRANEQGFQMLIHAIGDRSVQQVLDVYQAVYPIAQGKLRNRIEHAQIIDKADVPRIKETATLMCMQCCDINWTDLLDDMLGEERCKEASIWRTLIDLGNIIPTSSDGPVDDNNPFHNMYSAITRKRIDGYPAAGWQTQECMTRMEAVKSTTLWGAYAMFQEEKLGSLQAGKKADFIVVSDDILECDVECIKDISVLQTVIDGELVYEKP